MVIAYGKCLTGTWEFSLDLRCNFLDKYGAIFSYLLVEVVMSIRCQGGYLELKKEYIPRGYLRGRYKGN